MSTSPISFGSVQDQMQSQQTRAQQINQDFKKLSSSLQAGDMAAAQQAYSAMLQLLPNQAQSSQQATSGVSTISTDFKALGQALQSGDLSSAQSAFSQLKTDLSQNGSTAAGSMIKGLRGHHGHHHVSSTPDSDSSSSSSSSSSATSTSDGSGSSGSNATSLNLFA
jgi:ribosomal protein S20